MFRSPSPGPRGPGTRGLGQGGLGGAGGPAPANRSPESSEPFLLPDVPGHLERMALLNQEGSKELFESKDIDDPEFKSGHYLGWLLKQFKQEKLYGAIVPDESNTKMVINKEITTWDAHYMVVVSKTIKHVSIIIISNRKIYSFGLGYAGQHTGKAFPTQKEIIASFLKPSELVAEACRKVAGMIIPLKCFPPKVHETLKDIAGKPAAIYSPDYLIRPWTKFPYEIIAIGELKESHRTNIEKFLVSLDISDPIEDKAVGDYYMFEYKADGKPLYKYSMISSAVSTSPYLNCASFAGRIFDGIKCASSFKIGVVDNPEWCIPVEQNALKEFVKGRANNWKLPPPPPAREPEPPVAIPTAKEQQIVRGRQLDTGLNTNPLRDRSRSRQRLPPSGGARKTKRRRKKTKTLSRKKPTRYTS